MSECGAAEAPDRVEGVANARPAALRHDLKVLDEGKSAGEKGTSRQEWVDSLRALASAKGQQRHVSAIGGWALRPQSRTAPDRKRRETNGLVAGSEAGRQLRGGGWDNSAAQHTYMPSG